MSWAVFLDRDGTIVDEVGLIDDAAKLSLLTGAAEALKRLKRAGALLVVITNQPVVARGMLDEKGLEGVHERLKAMLALEGAALDEVLYCPHHPELRRPETDVREYVRDCECRKPRPGMILEAARRHGIDLARSFVVGDSTRDVGAARAAGCRAVLVETGFGGRDGRCPGVSPDAKVADLAAAADWILAQVEAPK